MSAPDIEEETPFFQVAGPLFLVLALAVTGKTIPLFNADLLLVAAIGLLTTAKWQIRGFAYSLILLAISAVNKHIWIDTHHLLQAVLEGSVAFSLLICALVSEHGFVSFASLKERIESRVQTIQYLEEDIEKCKEASMLESASRSEQLTDLQRQMEEMQAEMAALHILNEVLRKSFAKAAEEKTAFGGQLLQSEHRVGLLLEEINLLQKELNRLSDESELAKQNRELFQELNAARLKEAQTRLVNETLARLHAQESEKVKELEARNQILVQEAERTEAIIDQNELAPLEIDSSGGFSVEQIEELQVKEQESFKIQKLETEYEERIRVLSVRVEQGAAIELLYRQLKRQFEAKNEVLHQTRAKLFHTDTQLQTLQMQTFQKQLETDPLPASFRVEMEVMEEESFALIEENHRLQELITHLMQSADLTTPKAVKKKLKMPTLIEQASLF